MVVLVEEEEEDYSDLIEFQMHEATQFITQKQLEEPNETLQSEAPDIKIPYVYYWKPVKKKNKTKTPVDYCSLTLTQ